MSLSVGGPAAVALLARWALPRRTLFSIRWPTTRDGRARRSPPVASGTHPTGAPLVYGGEACGGVHKAPALVALVTGPCGAVTSTRADANVVIQTGDAQSEAVMLFEAGGRYVLNLAKRARLRGYPDSATSTWARLSGRRSGGSGQGLEGTGWGPGRLLITLVLLVDRLGRRRAWWCRRVVS